MTLHLQKHMHSKGDIKTQIMLFSQEHFSKSKSLIIKIFISGLITSLLHIFSFFFLSPEKLTSHHRVKIHCRLARPRLRHNRIEKTVLANKVLRYYHLEGNER